MSAINALSQLRTVPMTAAQISEGFEILRMRHDETQRRLTRSFGFGDRVTFAARGRRYNGTVQKSNIKTVSVRTDEGMTWRVSPSALQSL